MKLSSIFLVATSVLMVESQGLTPTTAGPITYSPQSTGSCEGCAVALVPIITLCIIEHGITEAAIICIKDKAPASCLQCVCEIIKKVNTRLGEICCALSGCGKSGSDPELYLLGLSIAGKYALGSNVGFSGCPSVLTYGHGSQRYRFVENVDSIPENQDLPCVGDIEKCIYTAHRRFYCMDGNRPDYTPRQLNPLHDSIAYQNVSTYAGTFIDGGNFTTPGSMYDPIFSFKLFPNVDYNRLVFGGFILKTKGAIIKIFKEGFQDVLPFVAPTADILTVGEGITEAFGRYGVLIDKLTFAVTPANTQDEPRLFTVGGHNGYGQFDATPPPHLNGLCDLVGLGGQVAGDYIRALEFNWSCVGKPSSYTY